MHAYDLLLGLHITFVLAAFFLSGALHACEYLMKGAGSVAEVKRLLLPGKFAPLFAVFVLGIFGCGEGMLHNDAGAGFHASDGWVWTAMVVLLILFLDGPLVLARAAKNLEKAVEAAPEGPVSPELRAEITSPVPWMVSHANSLMALSVIFTMTNKPGTPVAILVIVVATALGAGLGLALSKR